MSLARARSLAFASLLLCTSLGAFACGDDEQAAPVEKEDFCPGLALAICEGVRDCCEAPQLALDVCVANESRRCERVVLLEGGVNIDLGVLGSISAGASDEIEYDAQEAGDVVARADRASKTCSELAYPLFSDVYVVASTVPNAELRCLDADDCDPGFYCEAVRDRDAPGDCVRLPERDQPCSSACGGGLICFAEGGSRTRTCVPPHEEGAACRDDFECASGYCAGNTACAQAPAVDAAVELWCELEPT